MTGHPRTRAPWDSRSLVIAVTLIVVGTLVLLAAPFVRAEARRHESEGSVNSHGSVVPAASPRPTTTPGSTPAPGQASTPRPGTVGPPVVYLTFDDGPHPIWTPLILGLLTAYDARATFFELGVEVEKHPDLSASVLDGGHRIGNHTYDHRSLPRLSDAQIRSEIVRGPKASCLRPPFGAVNDHVRALTKQAGQHIRLWDVDTRDWAKPGVAAIERAVLEKVHPGATILMHDGGGDRSQTVAALRTILPELAARGYVFRALPGC